MTEWRQGGVTLITGDCLSVMAGMEAESVNCVVTSPPFWALRKYNCEPSIWGGDPNCSHTLQAEAMSDQGYAGRKRWQHDGVSRQETPEAWVKENHKGQRPARDHAPDGGFGDTRGQEPARQGMAFQAQTATCSLCGAWRGWLGLEPTVEMFIEHTLTWMRAVKRVLRNDGALWVDIDDSRGSQGGYREYGSHDGGTGRGPTGGRLRPAGKPKSLCLIPQRLAIAAQEDGWIVRSDIKIMSWMPESAKDRPTDAYRTLLMLVKQGRYWSDFHAVRVQSGNGWKGSTFTDVHDLKVYEGISQKPRTEQPGRNIGNVWTDIPPAGWLSGPGFEHFASFAVEEPLRCIKASCPPDGVVLDPFVGTGTTLIAARQLGRRAIGIDVSESYIEQAKKRLRVGDKGIRRIVKARRAGHEQEMFPDGVWS